MELIQGKNNGDVYAISFWLALASMFALPFLYLVGLLGVLWINDPLFLDISYLTTNRFIIASMVMEWLGDLIPLAIIFIVFKKIFVFDAKKFKANWILYTFYIFGGFILLFALQYGIMWLYDLLKIEGTPSNQAIIETALASSMRPFMFLVVVIGAPILEEMIFRKFLFGYLMEKAHLSKWVTFVIATFAFAAIHIISNPGDYIFIFPYLALSAVITLSYILSDFNIYVPIGLHFLNNLVSFFQS